MYNSVTLIGNVGRDPDVKTTASGGTIVTLSLATSERKKVNGEWADETQWHRIVVFGQTAEFVSKYVKKGTCLAVTGQVVYREWDKDGVKQRSTEIRAKTVDFFNGGKKADSGGKSDGGGYDEQETKPQKPAYGGKQSTSKPPSRPPQNDFGGDEDIPF